MSGRAKTAVVTGGAGGIGLATSAALLQAGWNVMIADMDCAAAEPLLDLHGAQVATRQLDVRDRAAIDAVMDAAAAQWGSLDGLVTLAGIQRHGALESFAPEDWDAVMGTNLTGVLHCMQAAARHMLPARSGAIVNIASVAAARGAAGRVAYAAAKAAVVSITQTAAMEWATRGIRVNAVGPGYVATNLIDSFVKAGRLDPEPILARIPAGRMAEPVEIARVIRFLLSDEASYITGQCLYADGGFLADFGVPTKPPKA